MSPLVRSCVPIATNFSTKADITKKYEECVNTLNRLQSNARTLEKTRQTRDKLAPLHIPKMIKWAATVGITLDDIDRLNVIHVSGTKGKGSTCAYCESILRHQGFKTGFFSSPHLVEVRERIQVNGQPLPREKFVDYFWDVYNKLDENKVENSDGMPAYFSFLTIMALHVFMKEKTDVAILEVGIGGQYDSTNLVRKPVACGVTSLGLDHVSILGNTIDKIAWQKAGIFKPGVPAFTAPQPPEAVKVLFERAEEIGCKLKIVPPFSAYETTGEKFKLGIAGHMQKVNASLSLQLTRTWLKSQGHLHEKDVSCTHNSLVVNGLIDAEIAESFPLMPDVISGLAECRWLGRNQTIKKDKLTYYLDGAHTVESIQQCVDWFLKHSKREADSIRGKVVKILIFNTTGDRDVAQLIGPLLKCDFDGAVFCPNISYTTASSADVANLNVSKDTQHQKCELNINTWKRLCQSKQKLPESTEVTLNGDNLSPNMTNGVSSTLTGADTMEMHRLADDCNHSNISLDGSKDTFKNDDITGLKQCSNDVISCSDHGVCQESVSNSNNFIIDFPCIHDAILWASHGKEPNLKQSGDLPAQIQGVDHVQILVTGSLHLVGGVLGMISDEYD